MLLRPLAAALLLSLVSAAPALAQSVAPAGSVQSTSRLGPSYVPADPITGPRASGTVRSGVGLVEEPFVDEVGAPARRKGVIGSLPIAPNVDIGIGLIRVIHKNPRSRRYKVDPMGDDVRGPEQKIAAVGLNLRF